MIRVRPEVEESLRDGRPVVALETTLVAHGFPYPEGAAVATESERRVRAAGAVPATVGVVDGVVRVVGAAARRGISGRDVTPFVLARLHERSGGRTAAANKALIVDNAGLAAEIAVAYAPEAG